MSEKCYKKKNHLENQKSHYFMQKRQISTNLRTEKIFKVRRINLFNSTINLFNYSFGEFTIAVLLQLQGLRMFKNYIKENIFKI